MLIAPSAKRTHGVAQLELPLAAPQPKEVEDGLKVTESDRGPFADDLLEAASNDPRPGKRVLKG